METVLKALEILANIERYSMDNEKTIGNELYMFYNTKNEVFIINLLTFEIC